MRHDNVVSRCNTHGYSTGWGVTPRTQILEKSSRNPRKMGLSNTKSTKTTRSKNQTGKSSVTEARSATNDPGGGARGRNNTHA